MVREVEAFGTELKLQLLLDWELTENRQIDVPERNRAQPVPPEISESEYVRNLECGSVEAGLARDIADVRANPSYQVGSFILVPSDVASVSHVSADVYLVGQAGARRYDGIQLPVSQDIVGRPAPGLKHLAFSDWQLIDGIERNNLSQIEAGWAAIAAEVIGIGDRLAFHAVPARGAVIDRFRPRVCNLIGQTLGVTFVQLQLEGIVVRLTDAAVVERRRYVRVRRTQLRVTRPGRRCHVIVPAYIQTPRSRSDVVD